MQIEPNCMVLADRQYLFQIMENLLSNAIKYSPNGKKITLSLRRIDTEKAIQIVVRDEGQGLTEEDKSKLFGKFQRLSAKPRAMKVQRGWDWQLSKNLLNCIAAKSGQNQKARIKARHFLFNYQVFKMLKPIQQCNSKTWRECSNKFKK